MMDALPAAGTPLSAAVAPVTALLDLATFNFLEFDSWWPSGSKFMDVSLTVVNLVILTLVFFWAAFALCWRRSRHSRAKILLLVCTLTVSGTVASILLAPSFTLAPILVLCVAIALCARAVIVHVIVPFGAHLCSLLTATCERGAEGASWRSWLLRDQAFCATLLGYRQLVQSKLEQIALYPQNVRLRKELMELHLRLGDYQNALYQGYVLVELLPAGPTQALLLYRISRVLVERLGNLAGAQPHLRRLIRLYPRTFFASYARRLVNHYEAYADRDS